nr:extracellular ligand-binding receptor [Tanacetum cinerariifolium]
EKPTTKLVKVTEEMKSFKTFAKIRLERTNKRHQGVRLKKVAEAEKEEKKSIKSLGCKVLNDICVQDSTKRTASCDGIIHVWNSQSEKKNISVITKHEEISRKYGISLTFVSRIHFEQANMLDFSLLGSEILSSTYDGSLYTSMHHLETVNWLVAGSGNGSLRFQKGGSGLIGFHHYATVSMPWLQMNSLLKAALSNLAVVFNILFTLALAYVDETNNVSINIETLVGVGIILDMDSLIGKSIRWCITKAISDFYALNPNYKRRLVLHTRDSKGDPIEALSAVDHLLNSMKVQAITGLETQLQSTLLTLYADRAKFPIFLFAVSSLMEFLYLFKLKEDNYVMAKTVASLMATLYLNTLEGDGSVVETDKEVKDFLFRSLDIPLVNLEASLKNYEVIDEPFDISSVPREVKSQPLTEKKTAGKNI